MRVTALMHLHNLTLRRSINFFSTTPQTLVREYAVKSNDPSRFRALLLQLSISLFVNRFIDRAKFAYRFASNCMTRLIAFLEKCATTSDRNGASEISEGWKCELAKYRSRKESRLAALIDLIAN